MVTTDRSEPSLIGRRCAPSYLQHCRVHVRRRDEGAPGHRHADLERVAPGVTPRRWRQRIPERRGSLKHQIGGQQSVTGHEQADQVTGGRIRRACYDAERTPRQPEVSDIDANHRDLFTKAATQYVGPPGMQLDGDDLRALGRQSCRQRTGSRTHVEDEIASGDRRPVDHTGRPIRREAMPAPGTPTGRVGTVGFAVPTGRRLLRVACPPGHGGPSHSWT